MGLAPIRSGDVVAHISGNEIYGYFWANKKWRTQIHIVMHEYAHIYAVCDDMKRWSFSLRKSKSAHAWLSFISDGNALVRVLLFQFLRIWNVRKNEELPVFGPVNLVGQSRSNDVCCRRICDLIYAITWWFEHISAFFFHFENDTNLASSRRQTKYAYTWTRHWVATRRDWQQKSHV